MMHYAIMLAPDGRERGIQAIYGDKAEAIADALGRGDAFVETWKGPTKIRTEAYYDGEYQWAREFNPD